MSGQNSVVAANLAPLGFVVLVAFLASWAFVWAGLALLRFVPPTRQTLVWAVSLGTLLCVLPFLGLAACCFRTPSPANS